jgi:hypothetical protein
VNETQKWATSKKRLRTTVLDDHFPIVSHHSSVRASPLPHFDLLVLSDVRYCRSPAEVWGVSTRVFI